MNPQDLENPSTRTLRSSLPQMTIQTECWKSHRRASLSMRTTAGHFWRSSEVLEPLARYHNVNLDKCTHFKIFKIESNSTSHVRFCGCVQVSVRFVVSGGTATAGFDFSVTSPEVTLLSGQRRAAVPIAIIDDVTPELNETFTVQLVNQISGGAMLGDATEAEVTIGASDNPHGKFGTQDQPRRPLLFSFRAVSCRPKNNILLFKGFETLRMDIQEPAPDTEGGPQLGFVHIAVARRDGTRGVVQVEWVASADGELCCLTCGFALSGEVEISLTKQLVTFRSGGRGRSEGLVGRSVLRQ